MFVHKKQTNKQKTKNKQTNKQKINKKQEQKQLKQNIGIDFVLKVCWCCFVIFCLFVFVFFVFSSW